MAYRVRVDSFYSMLSSQLCIIDPKHDTAGFIYLLFHHTTLEPRQGGECPMAVALLNPSENYAQKLDSSLDPSAALFELADLLFFHSSNVQNVFIEKVHKWFSKFYPRKDNIIKFILARSYESASALATEEEMPYLACMIEQYLAQNDSSNFDITSWRLSLREAINNAFPKRSIEKFNYSVLAQDLGILSEEGMPIFDRLFFCFWIQLEQHGHVNMVELKDCLLYLVKTGQKIISALSTIEQGLLVLFSFYLDDQMTIEDFLDNMSKYVWNHDEAVICLWKQWFWGWLMHSHQISKSLNQRSYQARFTDPLLDLLLQIQKDMWKAPDKSLGSDNDIFLLMLIIAFYSPFPDHRQHWAIKILLSYLENHSDTIDLYGNFTHKEPRIFEFFKEILTSLTNQGIDNLKGIGMSRDSQLCLVLNNLLYPKERQIVQDLHVPLCIIGLARTQWSYPASNVVWIMEQLCSVSLIFMDDPALANNRLHDLLKLESRPVGNNDHDLISLLVLEGYISSLQLVDSEFSIDKSDNRSQISINNEGSLKQYPSETNNIKDCTSTFTQSSENDQEVDDALRFDYGNRSYSSNTMSWTFYWKSLLSWLVFTMHNRCKDDMEEFCASWYCMYLLVCDRANLMDILSCLSKINRDSKSKRSMNTQQLLLEDLNRTCGHLYYLLNDPYFSSVLLKPLKMSICSKVIAPVRFIEMKQILQRHFQDLKTFLQEIKQSYA